MSIRPLKKYVLVAQKEKEAVSGGGIILQSSNGDGSTATGVVISIGPEVTDVAVDDEIILQWGKSKPVTVDGVQRVMILEEDIIAVLDK